MPTPTGSFVWYDVMTTDTRAGEAFYRAVFGWDARDSVAANRSYTLFSKGPSMVAGLMPIPEHAKGMPPMWMGYIGVDDVDACAEQVKAAGGAVFRPPEDIPDVGRFAVVADPGGAGFILFKGSNDQAPPQAPAMTPGHVGWHELHAGNGEQAFTFYSRLFGWTKAEAIDMGSLGTYQTFAAGGAPIGGMMTKTADTPQPSWLYYFAVDALDAAIERVKRGGGTLCQEPQQVPGDAWIAPCTDPQGAAFAMVAGKR